MSKPEKPGDDAGSPTREGAADYDLDSEPTEAESATTPGATKEGKTEAADAGEAVDEGDGETESLHRAE